MNKTIKQQLTAFIDPLHITWDLILPFITHAYNTSVQGSTRISPFRALYGRDPRLPPDIKVDLPKKNTRTNAMDWWLHLQQVQPILRLSIHKNLQLAQSRQKRCYDKGRRAVEYTAETKVLVYLPIRRQGLNESMMHRWIGPFTVLRSMRANTYSLRRDANGWMTYVHMMRMKAYVKHSTNTTTTQASQEESTHHNVPCVDESERPSTPARKQDETEPPYTSNRDAICDGNSSYVAPTSTDQRHHQSQPTWGGGCGIAWFYHRAKPLT